MRVLLILLFCATSAVASDWTSYRNARFGVAIDIPPGFVNDVRSPENGDGITFHSGDGNGELTVWGSFIDQSFRETAELAIRGEREDGWSISYVKWSDGETWVVYSGEKDSRIAYSKLLNTCDGILAVFRIEYPSAKKKTYDRIVERLARSLKNMPSLECAD